MFRKHGSRAGALLQEPLATTCSCRSGSLATGASERTYHRYDALAYQYEPLNPNGEVSG